VQKRKFTTAEKKYKEILLLLKSEGNPLLLNKNGKQ
jgi:hypothetical protein